VIRLGTRGSALALAQAGWVAERLRDEVELVPITTSGDTQVGAGAPRGTGERRGASPEVSDKSRFVKELEEALLAGEIDLAVHSAKDVPAELPRGLVIQAIPERADPRDALSGAESLDDLPEGAVVGTASLRRRAELLARRPDLDVRDVRGNVDTRLRRLAEGEFDALVLAQAGLERLGRRGEGTPLDPDAFVPAPGQGCLIVEARDADQAAVDACAGLTDSAAQISLIEERYVVRRLGATCHTPIGVHAAENDDSLTLRAFVGLPDGSRWIRDELRMPYPDAAGLLGLHVAERLLAAGAAELLAEAERATAPG
jgi:hydroxymethylbilane synthase